MEDEQEQKLVLSGLLVISDKFISKENAEAVRRRISMTKAEIEEIEKDMLLTTR